MSMSSTPQPTMQTLPICRATSAAWLVMPPWAVRMPCAASMPRMSSGLVKSRTSSTCSPRSAQATASAAEKTTRPVAAPGPAGRPQASALPALLGGRSSCAAKDRPQELVQLVGLDAHERLFGADQALVGHVDRDADGGQPGALAVARLQHEEAAALDRELEVLHVAHLALERLAHLHELLVDLGPDLFELDRRSRRADAGDHVLALGIDQELAVEVVLAGGRVAREAHAGARLVAVVAEDHGLHVDRRAPGVGDVVQLAVGDGAVVLPGAEHRDDGAPELLARVFGEVLPTLSCSASLNSATSSLSSSAVSSVSTCTPRAFFIWSRRSSKGSGSSLSPGFSPARRRRTC